MLMAALHEPISITQANFEQWFKKNFGFAVYSR